ncbi:MAG TPA: diguanylate cyclase [Methylotenera sp.]|nr:diguanylate cyclase [Methylotenera sp.]
MQKRNVRTKPRSHAAKTKFNVLLLESDADYALSLKQIIEDNLPVGVTIVRTPELAKRLLTDNPDQFFISITSVLNMDSLAFERIDLLDEFNLPVIAIVNHYEDEMRDQLIKRHVIDYVVKGNTFDHRYICDLISRVHKNCSIKVLVVDDSKVSRFIIARELELQKFQVNNASNGLEALDKLKESPDIKLVLVDNQMPNMNGYTFTAEARKYHSKDELIIIGVSGSTDPRIAVKFLKAGANDFIAKPFNYEMLLCRITQNLDMLEAVNYAKSLSNTDFLTGLYNRRYFFEQGSKLLESMVNKSSVEKPALTVMMMDIDFFKKINDKFGHDVGDEVIKNFAAMLKRYFADDIVARIGGEEFAVISQSLEYATHFDYINQFRVAVANQTMQVKQEVLRYTCSIGVTTTMGNSLDEMLVNADKCLYKAKQAGRNQIAGGLIHNRLMAR